MGITDLLKELPGGNAKTSTRYGFANLAILRNFPASIDTGTLLFVWALRHKEAYNAGRYLPALREFQRKTTLSGPGPGRGGDRVVPRGACGRRPRPRPKARIRGTYETDSRVSGEGYPRTRA